MNILMTNDDGYLSPGFMLLCKKLSEKHNVYVVAPDGQRSATSHATNYHKSISFWHIGDYCDACATYLSSGTPSDCVKYGLHIFPNIDVVVTGPNEGPNYAFDVLYSGTVGAAEEALVCNTKSIALSRLGRFCSFASTVEYFCKNIEKLVSIDVGRNTLLNVNVPNLPLRDIKGVKVTRVGERIFGNEMDQLDNGVVKFYGDERSIDDVGVECDYTLSKSGYITISPITIDRTDYNAISKIEEVLSK